MLPRFRMQVVCSSTQSPWYSYKFTQKTITEAQVTFYRSRMEGFETPKKMFTCLGIYPEAEGASRLEKMAHITFAWIVFTSNLFASLAHWGYFLKFLSIDLKGSIFAFMGLTAFSCLTYICMTVFSLRRQICNIIDKLVEIYKSRK